MLSRRVRSNRLQKILAIGVIATGGLWAGLHSWSDPEPGPIRIGVLHSLSGTMAVSESPLVDAIRLAVEEINRNGGLLGRPLEMIVADGRSDDREFATLARRMIERDRVSALFACWTSSCRKTIKPIVEKHQHLMFYPVQYEGLESSRNIVYAGSVLNQQLIPGIRWASERFGKRWYVIGSDYIFPRTASVIVRDVASATGATLLKESYKPLGSREFADIAEEIRRLQPDLVINTVNGDSNIHLFETLRQSRLSHVPVLSFSVSETELQAIGSASYHPNHYAVWSYFQSLPNEANRAFVEAYKRRFGAERVTSDPILASHDSVLLWATAVRAAGTANPGSVNQALATVSIASPSGIVAIDNETRHLWKFARVGRALANAQFELLYATPQTLRPMPFPIHRSRPEWQQISERLQTAGSVMP
jgi:urea transport system substrate-binding protein